MEGTEMIRYISLTCFSLFLAGVMMAAQTNIGQKKLPVYKMGKIIRIDVTVPTRRIEYNPQETCETFVMTSKLARTFLTHSKVAMDSSFFHQADSSSCQSEGLVIFANGDKGDWVISRNGVGLMSLTNGEFKETMIYLHCYSCENWKF